MLDIANRSSHKFNFDDVGRLQELQFDSRDELVEIVADNKLNAQHNYKSRLDVVTGLASFEAFMAGRDSFSRQHNSARNERESFASSSRARQDIEISLVEMNA